MKNKKTIPKKLFNSKASDVVDLGGSFEWSEVDQNFVDHLGFGYDIFLKAYFYHGQYSQHDGKRFYPVGDPYPYIYSKQGTGQSITSISKKEDPRTYNIPTCFGWNSAANCFHAKFEGMKQKWDVFYDVKSKYFYGQQCYWEIDEDLQDYVPIDIPNLNEDLCFRNYKPQGCQKKKCKKIHCALRFPKIDSNDENENDDDENEEESSANCSKSNEKEYVPQIDKGIDVELVNDLMEYLKLATNCGVPFAQKFQQLQKIYKKRLMSDDPQKLNVQRLKNALNKVCKEFNLPTQEDLKNFKRKTVTIPGPYRCPLCSRITKDYNRMLAHMHIHELHAKDTFITEKMFDSQPGFMKKLYKEEIINVVGPPHLKNIFLQIYAGKSRRSFKSGGLRARCYREVESFGGIGYRKVDCNLIHPIRTAFPDPFGQYSNSHVCPLVDTHNCPPPNFSAENQKIFR